VNTRKPIPRRDLLRLIVASGAVAALPGVAALTACDSDSAAAANSARKLTQTVANADSVKRVGTQSAAAMGDDSIARQLRKIFPENPAIEQKVSTASPEELRKLFAAQHGKDVKAGRVVEIDGWVLSNTEARLYAVVALAK
jgi:hypothetical protein